jgi:hypothetical protein
MEWSHLPLAGGIYDQHPQLVDDFEMIMYIENVVQKRKHDKTMAEQKRKQGRKGMRP